MIDRRRRPSFQETLAEIRREFALIRRRYRAQRSLARATPIELDIHEMLFSGFAIGSARRSATLTAENTPVTADQSDPVTTPPVSRPLDVEIEECERAFGRLVERLQTAAGNLSAEDIPAFANSFPHFFERAVAFERILRNFVERAAPSPPGPVN